MGFGSKSEYEQIKEVEGDGNEEQTTPLLLRSRPTTIVVAVVAVLALVLALTLSFTLTHAHSDKVEKVHLVILDSRIWTGDEQQPWVEAVAIEDGIIVDVGSSKDIKKYIVDKRDSKYNFTTTVLRGPGTVAPGFTDSHIHLLTGGFSLKSVDLRNVDSIDDFISTVAQYATQQPAGAWILQGNWNHENWGGILPNHTWIDAVTTRNPVWLCRLDGHLCLANNLSLSLANITKDTPDVEGGTIVRDEAGNPTGIFKDNALDLITNVIPPFTPEQEDDALDAAFDYLLQNGVTSVHHMGTWNELVAFERARDSGRLKIRIYAAVPLSTWQQLAEKINSTGRGDSWLKIGNLKAYVDGSLGAHTALLFAPYTDTNGNDTDDGLLVTPEEDLYEWIKGADKSGLQVSTHAIGDRANALILSIYENVTSENGPKDRRFRIEHAQTIRNEDRDRFSKSSIIASMQPYHVIDDGVYAEKLLGPQRIHDMYVFKSLLESGAEVVFGSDWEVSPPSIVMGIYAAMTRRTLDGKNPDGWIPEQKISLQQTLNSYTVVPAYASFDEDKKGKIKKGFLADLVFFSCDLETIDPSEIAEGCSVSSTIVDGVVVYNQLPVIAAASILPHSLILCVIVLVALVW